MLFVAGVRLACLTLEVIQLYVRCPNDPMALRTHLQTEVDIVVARVQHRREPTHLLEHIHTQQGACGSDANGFALHHQQTKWSELVARPAEHGVIRVAVVHVAGVLDGAVGKVQLGTHHAHTIFERKRHHVGQEIGSDHLHVVVEHQQQFASCMRCAQVDLLAEVKRTVVPNDLQSIAADALQGLND